MQVFRLSVAGVREAAANLTKGQKNDYYTLTHGEHGRGRWEVRIPLASSDYPADGNSPSTIHLGSNLRLIEMRKDRDLRGNPAYLLVKGEHTSDLLILWSLSPGYRGSAEYTLTGHARVIANGREAQGTAGRMGGADCPVVHVTGPCTLRWFRTGRLYGTPDIWTAEYDGEDWFIYSGETCAELAASRYSPLY